MGANLFYLGEFEESGQRLSHCIETYDPGRDEQHRFIYAQDPKVGALGYEPLDLWLLGYPKQALTSSELGLDFARSLDHPFTLTYALNFAALYQRIRGDVTRCRELAEELYELSSQRDVAVYRAVAIILKGSSMVEQGEVATGLEILEQGMAEYRATGSSVLLTYWQGLHADALRCVGQIDEAQVALDDGFKLIEQNGERWCEAELYRYRAIQLASQGRPSSEIESAFDQSIRVALSQGAKAWALRSLLGRYREEADSEQKSHSLKRLADVRHQIDEGSGEVELNEVDVILMNSQ